MPWQVAGAAWPVATGRARRGRVTVTTAATRIGDVRDAPFGMGQA
jgi:hypothetical protein